MFVFSVKDGEFRQFKGSRKVKDFLDFVEEKQWESVEPITSWQNPGSIQMGILGKLINLFIQYLIDWSIFLLINLPSFSTLFFSSGYFFKISYVMKDYHKILTEDYKFSTWVSYAFFTSVTILVGGLLGLVSHKIHGINFFSVKLIFSRKINVNSWKAHTFKKNSRSMNETMHIMLQIFFYIFNLLLTV